MDGSTIINQISVSTRVLEAAIPFIRKSKHHFDSLNIRENDVIVYIPRYFNELISGYITNNMPRENRMRYSDKVLGLVVVDGYEDKIVVAAKQGLFYGIKPQILLIK